jgi:outer membrane protein OmpA-like peptidoglycan-associated protein
MKSKFLLTLPLAATLMVPAYAQQSTNDQNNSGGQQPAATSQQPAATSQQPASSTEENLSARQPLQPETHEGFWGHLNPFARKKYVHRQLQPVRDRVNELDELTAANSKNIKDVDSRASEGIRLASNKASEADQHAVDAGNRAQQANQLAQQTTTRLQTVEQTVTSLDQYQSISDTEIRFRPGQNTLSARAKQALDQLAEPLKTQRGYIVEVQGFSSGKGPAAVENSQNMAAAVVRYLVINHDIPVYRIYTMGMGNAVVKTSDGTPAKRIRGGRVEIKLLHNSIADLSQTAQSSTAPQFGAPSTTTGGVSGAASSTGAQQQAQPNPYSNGPASNTTTNPNQNTTPPTPRQ